MAAFGISLCIFIALVQTESIYSRLSSLRTRGPHSSLAATLPLSWVFEAPTPEWRRALNSRPYYFLYGWRWYEWLGAIGPLVLFALLWVWAESQKEERPSGAKALTYFAAFAARLKSWLVSARVFPEPVKPSPFRPMASCSACIVKTNPLLARFAMALFLYGAFQQSLAMVLLAPAALVRVTPFQPMRYLHLEYIFLVLIAGGLLDTHVLRRRAWRWALLLIVANGGMFLSQKLLLPASQHLELPGRASTNPWIQAFQWIRHNTPADAYFALDPGYLAIPGEDYHSFRALAERSQLADGIKDAAVVTQVPELAPRWTEQVDAQTGFNRFQLADFQRLKERFGIDWVLLSNPPPARLKCRWHNDELSVCRIPASSAASNH
jgi:hypothetical protein